MKLKNILVALGNLCTGQKLKIVRHGEAETSVGRGHPEKIKFFTGLPRASNDEKYFITGRKKIMSCTELGNAKLHFQVFHFAMEIFKRIIVILLLNGLAQALLVSAM